MDEPLLWRKQKVASSLDAKIFDIPEHSAIVPILVEGQTFKERLVYGSLESPTSSLQFLFDPRPVNDTDDDNLSASLLSPRRAPSRRAFSDGRLSQNTDCNSPKDLEAVSDDPRGNDFSANDLPEDENLNQEASKERKQSWRLPLVHPEHEEDEGGVRVFHPIKRFLRKSMTAPALSVVFEKKEGLKRPQLKSVSSIVVHASVGLLAYLCIGILMYIWKRNEFSGSTTHPIVDALYFCIVTMCTIGYGDIAPISATAKLFACTFVLIGFGFIDILLSGMVAFVLERQETLLLSAVEGSHHETAKNYLVNTKKGRMRIRMKVALALLVVIGCLAVGTIMMHRLENLSWLDSFYLACMSVTTVGYGDHTFQSMEGRLFAAIWLLVSTLAVARAFLFFAEARIDRRNRLIAKWVLHRQMTVGDLVAADLDNNGYISKSEYVVYKLKEMGKISEKDIHEICVQFNLLDTDNSGRITLSCLMNS